MSTVDVNNSDVSLSGKTLLTAEGDATITGNHTFNRGAAAPFTIAAGATNVANLDADKIDGKDASAFPLLASDNALTGKQSAVNQPTCSVYNNAVQSLTDSVDTALIFNAEDDDVNSCHDNVTNNTRLTAAAAGLYLVAAVASFASSGTGLRKLWARKNGATKVGGGVQHGGSATVQTSATFTTLVRLAANDYIEIMARQTSGGALNAGDASNRELQNSAVFVKLW